MPESVPTALPDDPLSSFARRFRVPAGIVTALLGGWILWSFFVAADAQRFHNDDAYISFRYSRHIADGLGPVWNPGERVEGQRFALLALPVEPGQRSVVRAQLLGGGLEHGAVVTEARG